MKVAEKFLDTMIDALMEKFPDEKQNLEEFVKVMWQETYDFNEKDITEIYDFIEHLKEKILTK